MAEKQRRLGIIPNFFTIYQPNPVPLTPKLKFRSPLLLSRHGQFEVVLLTRDFSDLHNQR